MKANQSFRNEDEAVSPVIGVILMVAITVVLAAVVFVLVQNLGQGAEKAPELGMTVDNTARTVTIIRAPSGGDSLDWFNDVIVGGTCVPMLNGNAWPVAAGTLVSANDVVGPCATGETLTFTHRATNTAFREPITFP